MKKLLIVGAGGLGREVLFWARSMQKADRNWEVAGFIDDNPEALAGFHYEYEVLGSIRDHQPKGDEVFALAIGDPKKRMQIADSLIQRRAEFATIIHPSSVVGSNTKLGKGCVIGPLVHLSCDAYLDDFVLVTGQANVSHDARLGRGTTVCGHVDISGGANVGTGVFIGSHANLLPKSKVGDYAVVGAGSIVLKSVKTQTTVFGVPARRT